MNLLKLSASCLVTLLAVSSLQSCTIVGVDYRQPDSDAPDAWATALSKDYRSSRSSLDKWWKGFNDPVLNDLIDRARTSNLDLQIVAERIVESRAQRGVAASQLLPQANMGGNATRQRASESLLVPTGDNPSNFYKSGFDAGWEVDVFGGLRRSVESAEAGIGASEENYRDVLVTLFAEVAINYVEYRTLEERIQVADRNIEAQRKSRDLTENRFKNDLVPEIDVTQAETNLAISQSLIPALRAQLVFAKNRLSTLTGGQPGSLDRLLARKKSIPTPRKGYAAGLPADLLRARPDVRRAERELAAQTALIGVAEADLYPRFSLFGDLSLQSVNSGDFLNSASRAYSFGPSFSWQIFSAGRIKNTIRAEESRTRQALSAYEASVLLALEEVESSMANVAHEWDRKAFLSTAVEQSSKTVDLILVNYENDLVSFDNVLDAQRTLFNTEDDHVISKGQIAKNYITLYKALGGGTEMELIPAPTPDAAIAPKSEP
jgi:NodT family efflux transporter outer membrane factor (OMF) lipoprotein